MKINPYLMFNGNCEAAFKFYQQRLGGTITMMMTHKEAPSAENVSPEWHDKIMHACLELENRLLMGLTVRLDILESLKASTCKLAFLNQQKQNVFFTPLQKTAR